MEEFLATVTTSEWNHAMDAGRDRAEAVAELVAAHPGHEPLIRAWVDRWEDMLGDEIAGTAAVVDELADAGVRLLALTNWSAETFPAARRRYPSFARFEGIVVSGEHGPGQARPGAVRRPASRFASSRPHAVYVDDKEANVEAASALGFTGVLFTTPDALRDDLVRLGLCRHDRR